MARLCAAFFVFDEKTHVPLATQLSNSSSQLSRPLYFPDASADSPTSFPRLQHLAVSRVPGGVGRTRAVAREDSKPASAVNLFKLLYTTPLFFDCLRTCQHLYSLYPVLLAFPFLGWAPSHFRCAGSHRSTSCTNSR